ncbi:MAG TPA: DUF2066 domain-containing protein [Stellaceae bacterium]|jgi:hypothetical protein|nr:DUF2066 domain-containing protein [Stellaceae bacterium]
MTLPLVPACAGTRIGRRLANAAWSMPLLVVMALLLCIAPSARADDADPFAATVVVDATADNVAKARETARTDGQRRALTALVERLSGGAGSAKPLKLDDKAITNLVANFEVANERMSAVRYTAVYTFHFRPADIKRLVGNAAAATPAATPPGGSPAGTTASSPPAVPGKASDQAAKSVVVLPVYDAGGQAKLWDDPNPWREAWDQAPLAGALQPVIPLGDAGDIAAVDAVKAKSGDAAALAAVAKHNGGGDVLVAIAAPRGPPDHPSGVDVTLRRYRTGQPAESRSLPIAANPGEAGDALLRRAVAAIVADTGSGWKKETVPGYDQQGSLTAVLAINGLDDWVHMRERLAGVPTVRKIALDSLSRQEATIEIGYVGSVDQLKTALGAINLDLVRGDPLWRLTRNGADRAQ